MSLGNDVEFMDNKKYEERSSHKQATYEQDTTEKSTKTSDKTDGLLKRILKSILQSESEIESSEDVRHSQKTHKDFEEEISMGGKLKNLNISEVLHSAEDSRREQRSKGEER